MLLFSKINLEYKIYGVIMPLIWHRAVGVNNSPTKGPGLKQIVDKPKGKIALSEKVEYVEMFVTWNRASWDGSGKAWKKGELSGNQVIQDKTQRSMEVLRKSYNEDFMKHISPHSSPPHFFCQHQIELQRMYFGKHSYWQSEIIT